MAGEIFSKVEIIKFKVAQTTNSVQTIPGSFLISIFSITRKVE